MDVCNISCFVRVCVFNGLRICYTHPFRVDILLFLVAVENRLRRVDTVACVTVTCIATKMILSVFCRAIRDDNALCINYCMWKQGSFQL